MIYKKKTKIIFCSPTKCNQSREIDCLRFSESPAEPGQNLHCRSRRAKWSQIDSSGNGHHLPLHDKRDDFGLFSATTGRFGPAINSVEIAGFRLFGVIFSHTRVCRVFSFFLDFGDLNLCTIIIGGTILVEQTEFLSDS